MHHKLLPSPHSLDVLTLSLPPHAVPVVVEAAGGDGDAPPVLAHAPGCVPHQRALCVHKYMYTFVRMMYT